MSDLTADQLAQRILECRLLDARTIAKAVSTAGGRDVSYEELQKVLLQQEFFLWVLLLLLLYNHI